MRGKILRRLLGKLAYIAPGGYSLRPWLHRVRGVQIGKDVWISQRVFIDEVHPESVIINDNVGIGYGTIIFGHFYWGNYEPGKKVGKVIIEKNVYIGPKCVILHDVNIGEGSVIAAGTVVSRNVPPGVLYGQPTPTPLARVTRPLIKGTEYKDFVLGLRKL